MAFLNGIKSSFWLYFIPITCSVCKKLRQQYLILDTVEWFPVLELVGDSTRIFIVSDDDSETSLDSAHSIYHDN